MSTVQTLIESALSHHTNKRDNKTIADILEIVQHLVAENEGLRTQVAALEKKATATVAKRRTTRAAAKKKEA